MGTDDKKKLSSFKKQKNNKKNISKDKNINKYNDDILMLLKEADKITLDDVEFDNILKEETKILCNINNILNEEKGIKDENKICNISHLTRDSKFKEMISKISIEKQNINKNGSSGTGSGSGNGSKTESTTKTETSSSSASSASSTSESKIKSNYKVLKRTKKKKLNKILDEYKNKNKSLKLKKPLKIPFKIPLKKKSKCRKIKINKLSVKKKYIYKHNNKRKYDITIENPKIYIKGKT